MLKNSDLLQAMSAERLHMVQGQLQTNRVSEPRLVAALSSIPRELFTPPQLASTAYLDRDIDLGGNRYMLNPLHLAWLFDAAAITAQDRVLEVASNSGYGLALAAMLGRRVTGLESHDALIEQSRSALSKLQLKPEVVKGAIASGAANHAPYDVIIIAAAVDEVPKPILDQLAIGGRLVTLCKGKGIVLSKIKASLINQAILFEADKPLLPELAKKPEFVF
ncbi:MAG: protein-L-isoaspartate O-methyltransferase [Candidatus Pacebacteria bacterium]|nr:protein-L-isoaspartate O-methyltransferase [Candidatus Paceibacterota bacterium]